MSIEDNKKLVTDFWTAFSASDFNSALSMMAEDATWWVAGTFELSGTYTKAQFKELLGNVTSALPQGIKVTPKMLTAEGDRVSMEAESWGPHANGKIYNNFYHFMHVIREGKLVSVREYLDTMHTRDVFFG
jgi:ketosteroid isomerase-like protein